MTAKERLQYVSESEESIQPQSDSSDECSNVAPEEDQREKEDFPEFCSKNLKITKESIEYAKRVRMIIVNPKGEPLEEGAEILFKKNKIERESVYKANSIKKVTKNRRVCYVICVENAQSLQVKKSELGKLLENLREILRKKGMLSLSIAKSNSVANIAWNEFVGLLNQIFQMEDIEVTICTNTLVFVPEDKRDEILQSLHCSPQAGHKGVEKTYNRIKERYYWPNMKEDIQVRIQFCLKCQLSKLTRKKTKQKLLITDTASDVFDRVSLDVLGPLPVTKNGNEYILTMQDHLSRFAVAAAIPNQLTVTLATAFVQKFICVFGSPKSILSDNGSNFVSSLMKRICKRFRIRKDTTTPYRAASNGMIERFHHSLVEYIKQYADQDDEWDEWLDLATFSHNTTVHSSTEMTPFEIVFGKIARLPSDSAVTEGEQLPTYENYMVDLVTRLNEIKKLAYYNLIESKKKSKEIYDKRTNEKTFQAGDWIYLQKGAKPHKFGNHYDGPYLIEQVFPNHNVKIKIKKGSKMVHCNRIRLAHVNEKIVHNITIPEEKIFFLKEEINDSRTWDQLSSLLPH